jgi:DNA modification methylase
MHEGDARQLDYLLNRYSTPSKPLLTATITSPPYGNLKDYGHPDQIGWGQPYEESLVELRRIFRSIYRHTRDDGCLWVIADSLRPAGEDLRRLEPLPFQLAEELTDIGWTLRDVVIWRKDKTLPWSGRGRFRNAFEYILFFVKSSDFKFYVDRLRDPGELEQWWVKWPERYNPDGKVPDNVWEFSIPVQGSWGRTAIQHACPLPPDLVERMLLLSTDRRDVVFDCFAGSGVVLAEAERLGRRPIGIELVNKHIKAYEEFVRPEILRRRGDDLKAREREREELRDTILKLRALKYGRVLLQELLKQHPHLPRPAMALALVNGEPEPAQAPADPYVLVNSDTIFVYDSPNGEAPAIRAALEDLRSRKPASKFGVGGKIAVIDRASVRKRVGKQPLFLYTGGRTYRTDGPISAADLATLAEAPNRGDCPPIVGNVEVSETPRRRSRG